MLTRDSLGVFIRGEERQGLSLYGYWDAPPPPPAEPLFPYSIWPHGVEVHRGLLVGETWSVLVWDIAVPSWPDAEKWRQLLSATLERLVDAGAVLAWAGLEGHFADPPSLFDPAEMSGGVFAALTPALGFRCTASLDEEFRAFSDIDMTQLRTILKERSSDKKIWER